MNGEFFDNDEPKFTNDINMSHDDLIKFLYMDEIDNNLTNKIVSPLGVNFNQLRANMTDLLGNGMVNNYNVNEKNFNFSKKKKFYIFHYRY